MKKYLLAACVAVMGFSGSVAFTDEAKCYKSDDLRNVMRESGMKLVFVGVMDSQTQVIELWVKSDGEWIIVNSGVGGASCMLLNGAEHSLPTLKPNA